jgi:hypothetical protein
MWRLESSTKFKKVGNKHESLLSYPINPEGMILQSEQPQPDNIQHPVKSSDLTLFLLLISYSLY